MGDLIVYSASEHEHKLSAVLQKLRDAGFVLKENKFHFMKTSLCFLDHVVTAEGILAHDLPMLMLLWDLVLHVFAKLCDFCSPYVWLCQWQEHFHMDFRCTSELWRVKKVVSTLSNCLLCVFSLRVVIQSFSGCLFFSPSHVPLVIFLIVSQSRHSLSVFPSIFLF